jgi:hypothetical protein
MRARPILLVLLPLAWLAAAPAALGVAAPAVCALADDAGAVPEPGQPADRSGESEAEEDGDLDLLLSAPPALCSPDAAHACGYLLSLPSARACAPDDPPDRA